MELETPALGNACVAGHHASLGLQAPLALLCPQSRLGFACVCRISVVLKLPVRGGSLRSHPETEAGVSCPLQTPISRSKEPPPFQPHSLELLPAGTTRMTANRWSAEDGPHGQLSGEGSSGPRKRVPFSTLVRRTELGFVSLTSYRGPA